MRRVRRRWIHLSVATAFVVTAGCSEPEPTSYALSVTSIDGTTVCGEGPDTDEQLCFEEHQLDIIDGAELHLDDCVGVEVDADARQVVVRASWEGRCSARSVALGVTLRSGVPVVLIPHCLGSLVSLRLEDENGDPVWSVARETSTEHPLIEHVDLDVVPPGFAERDPLIAPNPDTTLTVTATQQLDLPDATTTFAVDELGDEVLTDGESFATSDEFLAAAGCRAA